MKREEKMSILAFEVIVQPPKTHIWNWNFFPRFSSLLGIMYWAIDYVLKNKNSSNFTRDANWPPNHKTYFGFALPCLWNVIIHFLIWCGWLGSGQIGRFLTGSITFHRPGRAKCKKCFVVRESMCISGEIRGIFGFSKRNLM